MCGRTSEELRILVGLYNKILRVRQAHGSRFIRIQKKGGREEISFWAGMPRASFWVLVDTRLSYPGSGFKRGIFLSDNSYHGNHKRMSASTSLHVIDGQRVKEIWMCIHEKSKRESCPGRWFLDNNLTTFMCMQKSSAISKDFLAVRSTWPLPKVLPHQRSSG